jgi:hypothetical protein
MHNYLYKDLARLQQQELMAVAQRSRLRASARATRPQRRWRRKPVDPKPTTVSVAPTGQLFRAPSTPSLTTDAN